MKKNDVWLSMQPILNDEHADEFPNPESNRKFVEVTKGTETIYLPAKSDKQHVYIRRGCSTAADGRLDEAVTVPKLFTIRVLGKKVIQRKLQASSEYADVVQW